MSSVLGCNEYVPNGPPLASDAAVESCALGQQGPECVWCVSGQYCGGGNTLGVRCDVGTWDHDSWAGTPCAPQTVCSVGQWVSAEGGPVSDRQCAECPLGTFSSVENSPNCAWWTACGPGMFVSTAGSSAGDRWCEPCPYGTFSETTNAARCTPQRGCAPGTYLVSWGTTTTPAVCESCTAGQYCAGGGAPVNDCTPGTWDHDANPASECLPWSTCASGQYVRVWGTTTSDQVCAPAHRVFASSLTYYANLGGLDVADAECQRLADNAGLGGSFRAWLSTPTLSVAERFVHGADPYVLLDMRLIASDWWDLTDGTIAQPIDRTERGESVVMDGGAWNCHGLRQCSGVFTGTNSDGTAAMEHCSEWTSTSGTFVAGEATSSAPSWTSSLGSLECNREARLYCFEQ